MRLNRSTLLLLVACIAIIAAVLLLNNNEAEAPGPDTTNNEEAGGPLFPDLTTADVVSLAVRDNESEMFTQITREETEDAVTWAVTGPSDAAERTVNQEAAAQAINNAVALEASDSFEIDDLEAFGLDTPAFTVELDTGGETLNVLFVGNQNPTGNRYYVMARQIEVAADETPGGPELSEGSTVFLVNTNPVEQITNLVSDPPFDPLPTATPTATATLNPMSEVEIATATAEAGATATAEMDAVLATMTAEAESTEEATAEVTEESE